jgi:hypothetical protein
MNLRQTFATINAAKPNNSQPVQLNGGEHRSLARREQVVQIVSGTAWITSDRNDFVIAEGEAVVLKPGRYSPLIASLNSQPVAYEVQPMLKGSKRYANAAQVDEQTDLSLLADRSWPWLIRLNGSHRVNVEYSGDWTVSELIIPANGIVVQVKDYGWVKVFRMDRADGEAEYWATSSLEMTLEQAAFRVPETRES